MRQIQLVAIIANIFQIVLILQIQEISGNQNCFSQNSNQPVSPSGSYQPCQSASQSQGYGPQEQQTAYNSPNIQNPLYTSKITYALLPQYSSTSNQNRLFLFRPSELQALLDGNPSITPSNIPILLNDVIQTGTPFTGLRNSQISPAIFGSQGSSPSSNSISEMPSNSPTANNFVAQNRQSPFFSPATQVLPVPSEQQSMFNSQSPTFSSPSQSQSEFSNQPALFNNQNTNLPSNPSTLEMPFDKPTYQNPLVSQDTSAIETPNNSQMSQLPSEPMSSNLQDIPSLSTSTVSSIPQNQQANLVLPNTQTSTLLVSPQTPQQFPAQPAYLSALGSISAPSSPISSKSPRDFLQNDMPNNGNTLSPSTESALQSKSENLESTVSPNNLIQTSTSSSQTSELSSHAPDPLTYLSSLLPQFTDLPTQSSAIANLRKLGPSALLKLFKLLQNFEQPSLPDSLNTTPQTSAQTSSISTEKPTSFASSSPVSTSSPSSVTSTPLPQSAIPTVEQKTLNPPSLTNQIDTSQPITAESELLSKTLNYPNPVANTLQALSSSSIPETSKPLQQLASQLTSPGLSSFDSLKSALPSEISSLLPDSPLSFPSLLNMLAEFILKQLKDTPLLSGSGLIGLPTSQSNQNTPLSSSSPSLMPTMPNQLPAFDELNKQLSGLQEPFKDLIQKSTTGLSDIQNFISPVIQTLSKSLKDLDIPTLLNIINSFSPPGSNKISDLLNNTLVQALINPGNECLKRTLFEKKPETTNQTLPDAIKSIILEDINFVRAKVHFNNRINNLNQLTPASSIQNLEWDESLADKAQYWAVVGTNSHDPCAAYGGFDQVIIQLKKPGSLNIDIQEVLFQMNNKIDPMAQEIPNSKSVNVLSIGNYSQILSPNTKKVGCGAYVEKIPAYSSFVLVCNIKHNKNTVNDPTKNSNLVPAKPIDGTIQSIINNHALDDKSKPKLCNVIFSVAKQLFYAYLDNELEYVRKLCMC